MESKEDMPGEWDSSETILVNLYNIQWAKNKIPLWMADIEYNDQIEALEEHINNYKGAFEVIRDSKSLRKVLSYTLTVGNILNGGNPSKGQADGFTLDAIAKLATLKDYNNKPLLQTIAIKIKNEDEDFGNIKREFEVCEEAIKISLSETKAAVDKLLKETDINVKKSEQIKTNDTFTKKIKPMLLGNQERIHKLDKLIVESSAIAQKVIAFFGYPKSDIKFKKPDDFLLLVSDFSKDLDKAIPVTEAKKAFKGTKPMGKKIGGQDEKKEGMKDVMAALKAKMGK